MRLPRSPREQRAHCKELRPEGRIPSYFGLVVLLWGARAVGSATGDGVRTLVSSPERMAAADERWGSWAESFDSQAFGNEAPESGHIVNTTLDETGQLPVTLALVLRHTPELYPITFGDDMTSRPCVEFQHFTLPVFKQPVCAWYTALLNLVSTSTLFILIHAEAFSLTTPLTLVEACDPLKTHVNVLGAVDTASMGWLKFGGDGRAYRQPDLVENPVFVGYTDTLVAFDVQMWLRMAHARAAVDVALFIVPAASTLAVASVLVDGSGRVLGVSAVDGGSSNKTVVHVGDMALFRRNKHFWQCIDVVSHVPAAAQHRNDAVGFVLAALHLHLVVHALTPSSIHTTNTHEGMHDFAMSRWRDRDDSPQGRRTESSATLVNHLASAFPEPPPENGATHDSVRAVPIEETPAVRQAAEREERSHSSVVVLYGTGDAATRIHFLDQYNHPLTFPVRFEATRFRIASTAMFG